LQSEYGVDLDRIHWFEGPIDTPGHRDLAAGRPDKKITIQEIPEGQTLSEMLESGDLHAMIGARVPGCLDKSDRVQRLFPNYRELERQYYRDTGIFPIMHTVVMKEDVHQANPWVAQSMYKALVESKRVCLGEMRFSGAMRYTLPWLYDDLDEMDEVFGGDPWPYGVESNRKNLETLQRYLIDQGFAKEARPLEELFTPVVGAGT
jgi:4,5-dihydroxyphthalate decarboxylase